MDDLRLADDVDTAPAPFARGLCLLGHADLERGAFVQRNANEMLEGLGIAHLANHIHDDFVADTFHHVGRRACLPLQEPVEDGHARVAIPAAHRDRKSTRLNSSHANISYAVFCLKKENKTEHTDTQ